MLYCTPKYINTQNYTYFDIYQDLFPKLQNKPGLLNKFGLLCIRKKKKNIYIVKIHKIQAPVVLQIIKCVKKMHSILMAGDCSSSTTLFKFVLAFSLETLLILNQEISNTIQ